MFKFLHAADIHLDSPLKGLARYEGAPVDQIRGATRKAFTNLVDLALAEAVQFVVIAGDIYDRDWTDYNTGLFFNSQMARLNAADIPVYLISGNHDAANKMTKDLRPPANTRRLGHKQAETEPVERCNAAIHGQSFATEAVTDRLAAAYPRAEQGCFNIGLLHTSAAGHEGHEPYAPCSLDELEDKGYHYWALGHVHTRQELSPKFQAVFAGNIQGRHIRETGPKGCLIVSVDNSLKAAPKFHPLDVLRWEKCTIDAEEADTPDDIVERFGRQLAVCVREADDRLLAVRVIVRGASRCHDELVRNADRWSNELRSTAGDVARDQVWIEQVKLETSPPPGRAPIADDALSEIIGLLAELRADDRQLSELAGELAALHSKLPVELREGPDSLRLTDPAWLRQTLAQVEPMLLGRLQVSGGCP